jgi:hypothetical protein
MKTQLNVSPKHYANYQKEKQKFLKMISRFKYSDKSEKSRLVKLWDEYLSSLLPYGTYGIDQMKNITHELENFPVGLGKQFQLIFGLEKIDKMYEMTLVRTDFTKNWSFASVTKSKYTQQSAKRVMDNVAELTIYDKDGNPQVKMEVVDSVEPLVS